MNSDEVAGSVVLVSHDRAFVDAVSTDIIMFANKSLRYFSGTFSEFEEIESQIASRNANLLDARVRQEKKARDSAEKMRQGAKHHTQLKQAKQKVDKIARMGLFRDDGKRFKLNSLRKESANSLRLPEHIEAKRPDKETKFTFPSPDIGALRSVSNEHDGILELDDVSCGYGGIPILARVTARVSLQSRIAVVGPNGAGKTTLLKLLMGLIQPLAGTVQRHPRLKLAYVAQNHTEALDDSMHMCATEYISTRFGTTPLEARSRLGRFGLGGSLATLPMQALSGGQKARISMTAITWDGPHLLVLDEVTNHLDADALRALADALDAYTGGVIMVSHNRQFCAACCRDLWVVDDGGVKIMAGDSEEAPFAELFANYTDDIMRSIVGHTGDRAEQRRTGREQQANKAAAKLAKLSRGKPSAATSRATLM